MENYVVLGDAVSDLWDIVGLLEALMAYLPASFCDTDSAIGALAAIRDLLKIRINMMDATLSKEKAELKGGEVRA